MPDVARTTSYHRLGMNPDQTVQALKQHLGVRQLELVVMSSIDEYCELLVEVVPRSPSWPRRCVLAGAALMLVAYVAISMVFHPGVGLDHLAGHLSVDVH